MRRTINFLFNLGDDIEQKKFSVGFLLDLSGSMQGEPLEQTKIAINNLLKPASGSQNILSLADQVSIVTFHSTVQKICPWVGRDDFDFFREFLFGIPDMADAVLKETGATALFDGMAAILESSYTHARQENDRIILLFSDGCNYGSERHSMQDVKNLIEKLNNGHIDKLAADAFLNSYGSDKVESLLYHPSGTDYYIFKPNVTESLIFNNISGAEHQQLLIRALKDSKKPIKVCSLYYRDPGSSTNGKRVLQEFADLSGGVLFDAPTSDHIPGVMLELFHKLELNGNSNIRSGLISRLTNERINENSNWFRCFSINTITRNIQKPPIDNRSPHTIIHTLVDAPCSRNDVDKYFKSVFCENHYLKNKLISNLHEQNTALGSDIQTNPFVFLVFKGNDIAGCSITPELLGILDDIRNDPNNILGTPDLDYHVFLVILLKDVVHYSDEDKRNLAALFNEINTTDPEHNRIHGIFLLGERNDHISANPSGFKSLPEYEFEQLVIENLTLLNTNQNLAIKAYMQGFESRNNSSKRYGRFLSIGTISLFADMEIVKEKFAYALCNDLFINLYNDNFSTSGDAVKREVDFFMEDLRFSSLRDRLLQGDEGLNLLGRFDAPSALDGSFTNNWRRIILQFVDQSQIGLSFLTRELHNESFIDFIKYLLFDVRNYVESCHAPGTFSSIVQERADMLLESKINQLQGITERLLYGAQGSSPKQAELWIQSLHEALTDYTQNCLMNEIADDNVNREYSNFSLSIPHLKITDDDPATPLDKLREKLESYPLPLTTRLKYYSMAGLFASGSLMLLLFSASPLLSLASFLIPLFTIGICEYRIKANQRQIKSLIKWYASAHRFRSRRNAIDIIIVQVNDLLEKLLKRIKDDNESIPVEKLLSGNLTEYDHLHLLRKALTYSFPKYFQKETHAAKRTSSFYMELTEGFMNGNRKKINIINESTIKKIAQLEKLNWKKTYEELTQTGQTIRKYALPSVRCDFLPPDFADLLNESSKKVGIQLSLKLTFREVIPERLYYLILLDSLTEDEIKELKGFLTHRAWEQKIDELTQKSVQQTESSNQNFMSLWRDVGYYQVWLNDVASIISKNQSGSDIIKSDIVFGLWKKIYAARREFKNLLVNSAKATLLAGLSDNFNLWQIIASSKNRGEIIQHIKSWCFAPVYLTNSANSYSEFSKLSYVSDSRYTNQNLQHILGKGLQELLDDSRTWEHESATIDDNVPLIFNHLVVIPLTDNSLLKSLAMAFNKGDVEPEKYFLEEFRNQHYKTKKQIQEYPWLFSELL